jgi:hypothetical protein
LKRIRNAACAGAAFALLLAAVGCKSFWVEADIENQTGQPIHELEVDYPTASFGTNALAPDASMHYRFKIRGNGPVQVVYTLGDGTTVHAQGLNLFEQQQGRLTIRLLPHGKAEFVPNLQPAS